MLNVTGCLPLHSFCKMTDYLTDDYLTESLFWCLHVTVCAFRPIGWRLITHVQVHTYKHPHKNTHIAYTVFAQSFYIISACFMISFHRFLSHWGFGLPWITGTLQAPLERKREWEHFQVGLPKKYSTVGKTKLCDNWSVAVVLLFMFSCTTSFTIFFSMFK